MLFLVAGLAGVQSLSWLGLSFKKLRVDLKAPLTSIDMAKLQPYRLIGSDRFPKEEVEALGTEEYIRYRLAHNTRLLSKVLWAFHRTVFSWQKRRAKACGIDKPLPGAVGYLQRFGSLLQLCDQS